MPHVESTIVIRAPRQTVLSVARDVESFPTYMADVRSLTVKERSPDGLRVVTEWVGAVPKFNVKVRWVEQDAWDLDAGTCEFHQISGDYDRFEGVWRFTDAGDGTTRFDSTLDYALEIPLVGGVIKAIIHKTMQNNLDSTLAAIKARCERQQPAPQ
jgi:uncharacterized membrane protein